MESRIPIQNLYYLLCYAWERLDERELAPIGATEPPRDVLNLLGRVLVRAVEAMVRRGFERGYAERREEVAGIRGRIELAPTVRRLLLQHGRAACVFDELEHDTPANRIIRATLTRLVCSPRLEDALRHEAAGLRRRFRDVQEQRVTPADCRRVVVHRNNRHYGFALHLCERILEMLLPDEQAGSGRFPDFTRDHRAMARLFEAFVRNFYMHHRRECGVMEVRRRQIAWAETEPSTSVSESWPGMETDLTLRRHERPPLVIDCKFYHDVRKIRHDSVAKLSAPNLYQLFAYVQNLRAQSEWTATEGLLLYAENGDPVDESRVILGARLRAATLNLDRPWPEIEARLKTLVQ